MTEEQMAINRLMCGNAAHSRNADYIKTAIKALEEIQQYRAIGTVEELEAMKKGTLSAMELVDIWCVLEDLKKYSAIGTIEEFKALKESNCKYWNAEHEDGALSYEEIRAKAVDEFAERLKADLQGEHWTQFRTIRNTIDKIAEQMKGDAE